MHFVVISFSAYGHVTPSVKLALSLCEVLKRSGASRSSEGHVNECTFISSDYVHDSFKKIKETYSSCLDSASSIQQNQTNTMTQLNFSGIKLPSGFREGRSIEQVVDVEIGALVVYTSFPAYPHLCD
jgi:hypothetical protein